MALPRRGGRAALRGAAAAAAALLTAARGARALDNGLARTPQMGYNTWNDYRCKDINATNIAAVADAMVSNGLRDAGARGRDRVSRRAARAHAAVPGADSARQRG